MTDREHFWRLTHLSDRQLLEGLQGVLRTQRRALAEIIAHLGEVEERRLHLVAAHSSMFSYCVQQLGMSEDEACRRIELARLARKFPLLFGELESGRLSLSVALLLKPVLTPDNHTELIAAARGASLRTARELLAERFPHPDAPSRIRKLPERSVAHATPAATTEVANERTATAADVANEIAPAATAADVANEIAPAAADIANAMPVTAAHMAGAIPAPVVNAAPTRATSLATATAATAPTEAWSAQPPRSPESRHAQPRQRIEPLSAGRYRIVFTADAALKQKLERARDLLRHCNPSGDLAPVVSRALDLLLQELLQRRFGARRNDPPHRTARPAPDSAPDSVRAATPDSVRAATPDSVRAATPDSVRAAAPPETPPSSTLPLAVPAPARQVASPSVASPPATALRAAASLAKVPPATILPGAASSTYIPRAARRAVLERDGLGCCWVDAHGNRCGSTAWLEHDHHHPAGKGGSSGPENLRLLCRAHNRFAAERAYGRDYVERAIRARRDGGSVAGGGDAQRRGQNGQPPSSSRAPT